MTFVSATGPQAFPAEERTDLTPRVVSAYRRANLVWLVGAIAAFTVAIVFAVMARVGSSAMTQASTAQIEGEADRIAAAIGTSARGAHMKAEGIAAAPMLRAAILTDAATVADVAATEVKFTAQPGEMLELFQVQDKKASSLLKLPDGAAIEPLFGTRTRLDNVGGGFNVVAARPIAPQDSASLITGQILLSMPVDLAEARNRLSQIADEAVLFGLGDPVILVAKRGGNGTKPISMPVKLDDEWKLGELTLQVTPRRAGAPAAWLDPVSYGAAGLASLLLLVWFIARRR